MLDITIIIPVFNEGKYLEETLKSIQNQSYKNFICLISDNASTDDSASIGLSFANQDKRFQYFKQTNNIGSFRNAEFLISKINTEYIMPFSGHDVIEKSFIEKGLEIIKNNTDISLVFSRVHSIDENSVIINENKNAYYDFSGNALSRYISSVKKLGDCTIIQGIFRSKVLEEFKFTNNIPGPDHIFLSHLMWHGKLHIIDEYLYQRRFFKTREIEYMERLTGEKNIKTDFSLMFLPYLEDFNKLYKGPDVFRLFLNNKILYLLTLKYGLAGYHKIEYDGFSDFLKKYFSLRNVTNPIYKIKFMLMTSKKSTHLIFNIIRILLDMSAKILKVFLKNNKYIRIVFEKYKKYNKRSELKTAIRESDSLKIVFGASNIFDENWIPTDINTLNLLEQEDWEKYFTPNSIDAMLAEHVLEHLTVKESSIALRYCFKYLKPNGYFRIAVPDGYHPDEKYIDCVKVGGTGPGSDDHKVLYTYLTLQKALENAGFVVQFLEYFNEDGEFKYKEWNTEEGTIHRSLHNDSRNKDGSFSYTSIIVDAIKK